MSIPVMAATVDVERAVPNLSASVPSLTANANGVHTPTATGGITVAQSPSGTSVTSTGRTATGTQGFLGSMNVLGGWNGVRNPDNKFK